MIILDPVTGAVVGGLKWLGGVAVGGFGTWWRYWNKRRRMTRHLYRELAMNYFELRKAEGDPEVRAIAAEGKWVWGFEFKYYEFAQRDMDTFINVPGYTTINFYYWRFRYLTELRDGPALGEMARLRLDMIDSMVEGGINARAFTKQCSRWLKKIVRADVKERGRVLKQAAKNRQPKRE